MVNQRAKDTYLSQKARVAGDKEDGEEYGPTGFGDIGKYVVNKERKLLNADIAIRNSALAAAQEQGKEVVQMFRDCVVYVNGYTRPSSNELRRLIVIHGGVYLTNLHLSGKTGITHIVASNLTKKKKLEFQSYKVVTPEWVVDSVKLGKMQDWTKYRLIVDAGNRNVVGLFKAKMATESFQELLDEEWSEGGEGSQVSQKSAKAVSQPGSSGTSGTSGLTMRPPASKESVGLSRTGRKTESVNTTESSEPPPKRAKPIPSFSSFELSFDEEEVLKSLPGLGGKVDVKRETVETEVETKETQETQEETLEDTQEEKETKDLEETLVTQEGTQDTQEEQEETLVTQEETQEEEIESLEPQNHIPSSLPFSSSLLRAVDQSIDQIKKEDNYDDLDFSQSELLGVLDDVRGESVERDPAKLDDSDLDFLDGLSDGEIKEEEEREDFGDIEVDDIEIDDIEIDGEIDGENDYRETNRDSEGGYRNPEGGEAEDIETVETEERKTTESREDPTTKSTPIKTKQLPYAIDDPRFISHFYEKSRLHHLSTWKARLLAKFESLSKNKEIPPPISEGGRIIMHLDFDSFFVAVSTLDRPDLQGKPVAVGRGGSRNADLASCNYEARKSGVKNGMWMAQALKLCPDLQTVDYNFAKYEEVSEAFYTILRESELDYIRPVSVDEALVDATTLVEANATECSLSEAAETVARAIAAKVRATTSCNISVGCSSNILLAKLALREAKPNGVHVLFEEEEISRFLDKTKIADIPGIGRSIAGQIREKLHVSTAGRLAKLKDVIPSISALLGPKRGPQIVDFCLGKDDSQLAIQDERKSVSVEISYGVRFENKRQFDGFVFNMAAELASRMEEISVQGSQLTCKLYVRKNEHETTKFMGHGQCDIYNKSVSLGCSISSANEINLAAKGQFAAMGYAPVSIRGVGIQITKLTRDKGKGKQSMLDFRTELRRPDLATTTPSRPSKAPSRVPPSTQFEIPDDIDPEVLPFLPASLRKQIETRLGLAGTSGAATAAVEPKTPTKKDRQPEMNSFFSPSPSKQVQGTPGLSQSSPIRPPSVSPSPRRAKSVSPRKRSAQTTAKTQIKRQKANFNIAHLLPDVQVCSEEMTHLKNELTMLKSALGEGTPLELVARMMPLVNSQTDLEIFAELSSSIQQEVIMDYRNEIQRKMASVSRQLEDLKEKERIERSREDSHLRTIALGNVPRHRPDTSELLGRLSRWVQSSYDGPHEDDVEHMVRRLRHYRSQGYHEVVNTCVRWLSKLSAKNPDWSATLRDIVVGLEEVEREE
ncbi:DNA repair protein [Yarrowia sp. C11]|nr:DNA repair protein [Yarrowia sp. C11]KAG5364610.1 DNA repair protein [Yarrowia sp. E02]